VSGHREPQRRHVYIAWMGGAIPFYGIGNKTIFARERSARPINFGGRANLVETSASSQLVEGVEVTGGLVVKSVCP